MLEFLVGVKMCHVVNMVIMHMLKVETCICAGDAVSYGLKYDGLYRLIHAGERNRASGYHTSSVGRLRRELKGTLSFNFSAKPVRSSIRRSVGYQHGSIFFTDSNRVT